jgi:UDP-glucuronate 4-epimerase
MAPLLFAQKMKKQLPIQLFGNGVLKRDFTFVGDTVEAVRKLIESNLENFDANVVNVGHSNPTEVLQFVETLSQCLGIQPIIELAPMQVSDVPMTCASDDKLRQMIGEWPQTSLQDGLQEMTHWFNQWYRP